MSLMKQKKQKYELEYSMNTSMEILHTGSVLRVVYQNGLPMMSTWTGIFIRFSGLITRNRLKSCRRKKTS